MATSFEDISLAFAFVGSASPGAHDAILCRRTGKIYYRSDLSGLDELEDELPDEDVDDENYVAIPHKHEFDLGKPLVLDFAREFLTDDFDDVRDMFSKRGAYPKFKALLKRRRALERWYAFEATAANQALGDWCERNTIEVSD